MVDAFLKHFIRSIHFVVAKWEDVLHQHCCYANLRKLLVPIEVCPPVEPRPRSLSVTDVGLLIRDPYAVYAKHILKLKTYEPPFISKWGNKRAWHYRA